MDHHTDRESLGAGVLDELKLFALKLGEPITKRILNQISRILSYNVQSLYHMKKLVDKLSGLSAVNYHCCVKSCVAFTGPHASLTACPRCKTPRYCSGGKRPRKIFRYIPLIPRLLAFFLNRELNERMRYRAKGHPQAKEESGGCKTDIFDGTHYRNLLKREVMLNGHKLGHKYFEDPRDIALGFGTDGVGPFRRRKATCWPLLVYNYNLPPTERFHDDNAICLGEVPGPHKPKDMDSFLYPAAQEMLQLAVGVEAWEAVQNEKFILRAFFITIFGDIPAVSMLLRVKGHNARVPCRLCTIQGIRIPDSSLTTYYVPHSRKNIDLKQPDIDPANLPLRTHLTFIAQANEVQSAKSNAESDRLATAYGINGVPLLSVLDSLSLPLSTGYEFMHLIFENLLPNLALFWSGNFKTLNQDQPFVINKHVWDSIGALTAASKSTIPSCYGTAVPNIATDRSSFSAEAWSQWALFVSPIVLNHRFEHIKYYNHFCDLVRLINLCLQYQLSGEELVEIRMGFIKWVKDYEKCVLPCQLQQFFMDSPEQVLLSVQTGKAPVHDPHHSRTSPRR